MTQQASTLTTLFELNLIKNMSITIVLDGHNFNTSLVDSNCSYASLLFIHDLYQV